MMRVEQRMTARLASFFESTARHVSKEISARLAREPPADTEGVALCRRQGCGTTSFPISKASDGRIRRDAFLYMGPGGPDFAQCGSCGLFRPGWKTCAVVVGHIVAEGSCGLYAAGPSRDDQPQRSLVPQSAAGYVVRPVRCENCRAFDVAAAECDLYRRLNAALPEIFDLNSGVDRMACCNAQEPMTDDKAATIESDSLDQTARILKALVDDGIMAVKSSSHSDLHVQPENAVPIWGILPADVVTRANVQHVSWEMVREGKTDTVRQVIELAALIATQQVVDRQRVDKHEQMLRETGKTESQNPPLVLLWDGDYYVLGGHHGLQAAYNLEIKNVEVDVMVAPD